MINYILVSLRIYLCTLVVPLALSVVNIIIFGLLGVDHPKGIMVGFKVIWIDYYFTGSLLGIMAWRIHLTIIILLFIIAIITYLLAEKSNKNETFI